MRVPPLCSPDDDACDADDADAGSQPVRVPPLCSPDDDACDDADDAGSQQQPLDHVDDDVRADGAS